MIRTLEDISWDLCAVDCIYSKDPPTPERRARVAALMAEARQLEEWYWAAVREADRQVGRPDYPTVRGNEISEAGQAGPLIEQGAAGEGPGAARTHTV